MIGRFLRGCMSLLVYFCLATVLSELLLAAYYGLAWKVNREKLVQVAAVLQGVDLAAIAEKLADETEPAGPEQVSYDQIMATRAVQVRHLELREQALKDALAHLAFEQRSLADEKNRYQNLKTVFDQTLSELRDTALASGTEDVRTKLEGVKAKQAKELLMLMLKNNQLDEVVTLMRAMPTTKAAKIMGEFKTPEEAQQLYEILQQIGDGFPEATLAADTRRRLNQPEASKP